MNKMCTVLYYTILIIPAKVVSPGKKRKKGKKGEKRKKICKSYLLFFNAYTALCIEMEKVIT